MKDSSTAPPTPTQTQTPTPTRPARGRDAGDEPMSAAELIDQGKVALGARNLFGKEPPITRNSFAHSFDGAYDLPGGGFFYLQYNQKF